MLILARETSIPLGEFVHEIISRPIKASQGKSKAKSKSTFGSVKGTVGKQDLSLSLSLSLARAISPTHSINDSQQVHFTRNRAKRAEMYQRFPCVPIVDLTSSLWVSWQPVHPTSVECSSSTSNITLGHQSL